MPEQGSLASLFDVEFKALITTKVIKVLYILSMIVIASPRWPSWRPGSPTAWRAG
jgi:hypothetical protein